MCLTERLHALYIQRFLIPCSVNPPTESNDLRVVYFIVAAVVGIIFGALGVGLLLWFCQMRRRKKLRKFPVSECINLQKGGKKMDAEYGVPDKRDTLVRSLDNAYEEMVCIHCGSPILQQRCETHFCGMPYACV